MNNLKGLNAFDYMTGLRLVLKSPNQAIIVILFLLTVIKGEIQRTTFSVQAVMTHVGYDTKFVF